MAVEIISEGKLNCHDCDDTLKKERGCAGKGVVPFWIEDKPVFRCPLTLIAPLSWEYIKAFNFYEKALLPNGNAWQNESNKFIQAMMVLDNEFSKIKAESLKKKK